MTVARIRKNLEEGGASSDFNTQVCVEYNLQKIKDINQSRKKEKHHLWRVHIQS